MAKFVLTTWAACFARQKPVSTRAKPGLHEDDEHGADDDPQQVRLDPEVGHRLHRIDLFLRPGDNGRQADEGRDQGSTYEELAPHQRHPPFTSHQVRGSSISASFRVVGGAGPAARTSRRQPTKGGKQTSVTFVNVRARDPYAPAQRI